MEFWFGHVALGFLNETLSLWLIRHKKSYVTFIVLSEFRVLLA